MKPFRFLVFLAGLCALAAHAELKPGENYRTIAPQPVATPGKIEVIEFFFYGCPHCYDLQQHFTEWQKHRPADVALRRIPAVYRDSWEPLARTFFTLEALGEVERLHQKVYDAYHLDELSLSQEEVVAGWAEKQGIPRDRFLAIYRSAAVQDKAAQARRQTRDYDIRGTPSLVVEGKYLVSGKMAGSTAELIPLLDELIALARAERSKKRE